MLGQITGIVLLGAAGANKVTSWIMVQGLPNGLYSYSTEPQILPLPNNSTAVLTTYQVRSTGSYESPCMTVIDSSGTVKTPGEAFLGNAGGLTMTMYNNGSDNDIYYGQSYQSSPQTFYAVYSGATYNYPSTIVRYGESFSYNYPFSYSRPKPGYFSSSPGSGDIFMQYTGTSYVRWLMGYNTGTYGSLGYRGQVDVDSSNNPCYVVSDSSGNILFGRANTNSYTGRTFSGAGASIGNSRLFLSMRANNTAFIGNYVSTTESRLHVIDSSPAMTSRVSFTYSANALNLVYVAHDPDDATKAYLLFSTNTNTEIALVRVTAATGVVDYQKVFTFGWNVNASSTVQMSVYGGYVFIAGKSTNAGASIAPWAFYMKLNKNTITNGTYQTLGRSVSSANVTIGTLGTTITPSVLSNLSLGTLSLTRTQQETLNMSTQISGLVPFFFNGTATGV